MMYVLLLLFSVTLKASGISRQVISLVSFSRKRKNLRLKRKGRGKEQLREEKERRRGREREGEVEGRSKYEDNLQ